MHGLVRIGARGALGHQTRRFAADRGQGLGRATARGAKARFEVDDRAATSWRGLEASCDGTGERGDVTVGSEVEIADRETGSEVAHRSAHRPQRDTGRLAGSRRCSVEEGPDPGRVGTT